MFVDFSEKYSFIAKKDLFLKHSHFKFKINRLIMLTF